MARLPAICDRCGTVFNSAIAADNVRNLRIVDCRAGPCPACGATGHIPDGLYEVVGNVINVLQAPERTVAELRRLKEILENAWKHRETPQATADRVERDLPALRAVADEIRRSPISLVLAAILVIQGARDSEPKGHDVIVQQIINNYVTTLPSARRSGKPKVAPPATAAPAQANSTPVLVAPKPGRNEPCSCGSGKKYKKCCGAPPPLR